MGAARTCHLSKSSSSSSETTSLGMAPLLLLLLLLLAVVVGNCLTRLTTAAVTHRSPWHQS